MKQEWCLVEDSRLSQIESASGPRLIQVKVRRRKLCLIHQDGKWHALDARCPHAGGPLAGGFISEDQEVVCPWHRFKFNLKTGQSNSGGYFVNVYPVKVEKGQVWVQLPKRRFLW